MKSFAKPTAQLIDAVEPLLSAAPQVRYFFDQLKNPLWIGPLRDRGFFAEPPPAQDISGAVRHPPWPESRYLARMASLAPDEVASILEGVSTDNAQVARDIVDAASAMPASIAAALVPKLCEVWKLLQDFFHGFGSIANLCARLAQEGAPDAAVTLARSVFAVSRVKGHRRSDHAYFEGLAAVTPALISTRTEEFLCLLLGGLKRVVKQEMHSQVDAEYDGSHMWRPAIEEHKQNFDFDFGSRYVGCVREALELAVRDGHLLLPDALQHLECSRRLVFRRLRVHLINVFAEQAAELARQTIMDRALFDNYRYKHEYAMLCGRRFPLLTPEERATWFAWVDEGPDMSRFDDAIRENLGQEPTEQDRKGRIEYWQFEKLHWVRDHLQGDRQAFYQRMLSEHGEPTLADLNVRYGPTRWGSESPFTVEELREKEFTEVVDLISAWRPKASNRIGPDVEGAAAAFRTYLSNEPAAFAAQAPILKHRPPVYVRTFLDVMTEKLGEMSAIDLSPVVDLCRWIVSRPVDEPAGNFYEHHFVDDKDWQYSRNSISDFILTACRNKVSLDYRNDFWDLLVPLTHDSGESYMSQSPDTDPRPRDYASLSINSPCGKAMHAVFAYARWIAESVAKQVGDKQVVNGGFDQMPEVRDLLEERLACDGPAGYTIRATYGWFWSLINWIDRSWLARHAAHICDLGAIENDPNNAYGWAAWNTFLLGTHPHIDHYRLLREAFSCAVDQAATVPEEEHATDRPFERLAEHVIVLYGHGQLSLDNDGRIVQRLLTKAAPAIRTHAIQFVGESLWREDTESLPEGVKKRFTTLWDWYWDAVGEADAKHDPQSGAFSHWFVCGVFDAPWSIERLEQFVRVVPRPSADSGILKKLAEIAEADILRSVRIVGYLVDGDDENWRIYGWRDHAKKILAAGLAQGSDSRLLAEDIIDRLGRRGFVDFGELLATNV